MTKSHIILVLTILGVLAIMQFQILNLKGEVHSAKQATIDLCAALSEQNTKFIEQCDRLLSVVMSQREELVTLEGQLAISEKSPLTLKEDLLLEIEAALRKVCKDYPTVDISLVRAVIWKESNFDSKATSANGKYIGLMQIAPRWHSQRAESLGVSNLYDVEGNIRVGVDYLCELLAQHKDAALALMIYNMGSSKAEELYYKQNTISQYAKSILAKADEYREEAK